MTDLADAHTDCVSLKGKRVAVTGGTTGIGRAIAVLLAEDIAVGVQYLLIQPRRAVVQQLTIAPREQDKE